jgi:hypothetical protein
VTGFPRLLASGDRRSDIADERKPQRDDGAERREITAATVSGFQYREG